MTRPTPERIEVIREAHRLVYLGSDVEDLLAEIDALRAENKSQHDFILSRIPHEKRLRARVEKLRIALGQIISITDDCPHMSNYAKDVFEKHCRNAIAKDDEVAG